MANYQLVNQLDFAHLKWCPSADFRFAEKDMVCTLAAYELPKAAMCMPLGFVETDGQFVVVAVQGLHQDNNAYVAVDGRWLLPYVPAAYRCYPFRIAELPNSDLALCFDMDSGLLNEAGEPFFVEDGSPSSRVGGVIGFLEQFENSRKLTAIQISVLHELDLFVPWEFDFKTSQLESKLLGLHRIDEIKLKQLSSLQFEKLRECDALGLVYCHLLSLQNMQHLLRFVCLKEESASRHASAGVPKELDLSFMNSGDTLSFG